MTQHLMVIAFAETARKEKEGKYQRLYRGSRGVVGVEPISSQNTKLG